jgi:hypothetical protein
LQNAGSGRPAFYVKHMTLALHQFGGQRRLIVSLSAEGDLSKHLAARAHPLKFPARIKEKAGRSAAPRRRGQ